MTLLVTQQKLLAHQNKKRKQTILFALVSVVWLVAVSVLLVVSDRQNYFWFMVGNIVLSVLYGWFAVYFFNVMHSKCRALCEVYQRVLCGEKTCEKVTVVNATQTTTYRNIQFRVLNCIDESGVARDILLPIEAEQFAPNQKLFLEVRANTVVSYEVAA